MLSTSTTSVVPSGNYTFLNNREGASPCLSLSMELEAQAEAKDKVEVVQRAIQQLMDENSDDENGRVLLSRMLLQLESLKIDATKLPEPLSETKELKSSEGSEETTAHEIPKMGTEETIVRELQKVQRQNSITHWLLSALIVVTVVWQLSEVSLILMVKNKVSNPLRAVGNLIRGVIKGGGKDDNSEKISLPSSKWPQPEPFLTSPLKMPEFELPHVDLPRLNGSKD